MKPAVSMIQERPNVQIEPRRVLTRRETIELAVRQEGLCGCGCGVKLDALREGVIDEHVLALILGGTNDLANRSLWRKPCAVAKTKGDRTADARVKRLREETCTAPAKPIPARANAWPAKGSVKIRSAVFPKRRNAAALYATYGGEGG